MVFFLKNRRHITSFRVVDINFFWKLCILCRLIINYHAPSLSKNKLKTNYGVIWRIIIFDNNDYFWWQFFYKQRKKKEVKSWIICEVVWKTIMNYLCSYFFYNFSFFFLWWIIGEAARSMRGRFDGCSRSVGWLEQEV